MRSPASHTFLYIAMPRKTAHAPASSSSSAASSHQSPFVRASAPATLEWLATTSRLKWNAVVQKQQARIGARRATMSAFAAKVMKRIRLFEAWGARFRSHAGSLVTHT